jgi:hypothetical protein
MGSGLLASAAVLIVVGWRWLRRETTFRALWPTLALGLAVIALGLLTRVDVEWHRHMKAKSVHDFVFSIIHSMQWPWRDRDWAALVLWLPWLVAAGRVLTSPRSPAATLARAGEPNQPPASLPPAGPAIVALGGWVLLQLAATAYARGAGADYPASRYMDTLSFGAAINALALAWLLSRADFNRRLRLPLYALGLGWVVTLGLGLHALLGGVIGGELPSAKDYYNKAEGHMRRYVATLDPKMLAYQDIPYPSAQGLIDPLSVPSLRAMMPVPIRPPLSLAAASPATSAFRENNAIQADIVRPPRRGLSPATAPLDSTRSWGSFDDTGTGAAAQGEWRSAPLPPPPPRSGWLRFETAGQLGQPGLTLEVRDAATDALLATVRPSKVPGDAWRSTVVRAPRVAYRLVARDADSTRWFAFSGPIEMGSLSYWAWQATKHSLLLLYASSAATLLFAGLALVSRTKLRD